MTSTLWNHFFQTTMRPVYYEGQPYVDLQLVSRAEYPALDKLAGYSTLEILVLGWLISWRTGQEDDRDTWMADTEIVDIFANYDCSPHDINHAISTLYQKGLVVYGGASDDGAIEVRANIFSVWQHGLLETPFDSVYLQMGLSDKEKMRVMMN